MFPKCKKLGRNPGWARYIMVLGESSESAHWVGVRLAATATPALTFRLTSPVGFHRVLVQEVLQPLKVKTLHLKFKPLLITWKQNYQSIPSLGKKKKKEEEDVFLENRVHVQAVIYFFTVLANLCWTDIKPMKSQAVEINGHSNYFPLMSWRWTLALFQGQPH